MAVSTAQVSQAYQAPLGGVQAGARLEEARSRIEQRFLDGGAVLLSVLDILNRMIGSLDALTQSLDEETAAATMGELNRTVSALSDLAARETARQTGFRGVAETEKLVRPNVGRMQETLRYLRTFAVTAKITGAGIADFAGFAEEILQRIQEGADQVNAFSDKLKKLSTDLGPVMIKGEATVTRYKETIPQIVQNLSTGVDRIKGERRQLAQRADEVKAIARGIQNKLSSTLSAMQIGDITRQRIEHCQYSFEVLSDYLGSPEGSELNAHDRQRLTAVISRLVALQLDQSRTDFDRDTARIVQTIASFRSDLGEITAVQQAMMGGAEGQSNNVLRELEGGIAEARAAVAEIEDVARAAEKLSEDTVQTVRELLDGIGVVQNVRGDIHYMALNTNLRCSRIGEEGKAINVVTAELRHFAAQLDESAELILVQLNPLEDAARHLLDQPATLTDEENLDTRLERALGRIRSAGDQMESDLSVMAGEGQRGVDDMNKALSRLDFQAELGEILRRCYEDMASTVPDEIDMSGLEAAIAVIGPRINKKYTMASERELHAAVLGTEAPEEAPLTTTLSDDDLDAALF